MSEFEIIKTYEPDKDVTGRQEQIEWWNQAALRNAKVMVAGAGAIGNETLKNLALLGFGNIFLVDFDSIELSNLSRTVLFRKEDEGKSKVEVASDRMSELALEEEFSIDYYHGNIVTDIGPSIYREMDLVLGCLDNVAARQSIDLRCREVGIPWIDAGMRELASSVTFFDPNNSPSYYSTLSDRGRQDMVQGSRKSCYLFKQEAAKRDSVATTQIAAAMVAALQTQEAVKYLCGQDVDAGKRIYFQGLGNFFQVMEYGESSGKQCLSRNEIRAKLPLTRLTTLLELLNEVSKCGGPEGVIELQSTFIDRFELNSGEKIEIRKLQRETEHVYVENQFSELGKELGREDSVFDTIVIEQIGQEDLKDREWLGSLTLEHLGFPFGAIVRVSYPESKQVDHYEIVGDHDNLIPNILKRQSK